MYILLKINSKLALGGIKTKEAFMKLKCLLASFHSLALVQNNLTCRQIILKT